MKKLLSYLLAVLVMISCLTLPAVAVESEKSVAPEVQLQVTSHSIGEQVPFQVTSASIENVGEDKYEADYEIFVPVPSSGIMPLDSISQEQDDNGLTAKLKIVYYYKSVGDIKITEVSGSWTGSIVDVELRNREVGVTDGVGAYGIGSKQHRWYPTRDTFSYQTGWDYVPYTPHDMTIMTGPRAYSEVEYRIPGMGGWDWHSLLFTIDIKPNF